MAALDFSRSYLCSNIWSAKTKASSCFFCKRFLEGPSPSIKQHPLEVGAAPPDGPDHPGPDSLPPLPGSLLQPSVNPAHLKCPLKRALFG